MLPPMKFTRDAWSVARGYLRENPGEIGRAVRSAMGLRVGLPFEALHWLVAQLERSGRVDGLVVEPVPPGIRVGANVTVMKTPLRVSATMFVELMQLSEEAMEVTLRLEDVRLALHGESK